MLTKKKGEWIEIHVPKEWVGHSIEYILHKIWQAPRGLIHQLRMGKGIKINDILVPWSKELKDNDRLQIHLFQVEDYGVIPNDIKIDILYEDDHILIVNKPAGMDTHPTKEGQMDTLGNAVAYHYQRNSIRTKIRHIHRLDKDTTGAILFAKDPLSGAIMDRQLEQRKVKRVYLAIVRGYLKGKKGIIDKPIGRDRHHPSKRRVSSTGQKAVTFYEVLHYNQRENTTVVKLQLETGRTHQIRVHMSYIGHPLMGDKLYNDKNDGYERQGLHAGKISFSHPITNKEITCFAPFLDDPPIFEYDVIKLLGIH